MKKILFFILLSMSVTCFGQGTQSIDSIQITEADSIHAGSHTFSDTKLEDVTKAEGGMIILGIDPGYAIVGYGVIEFKSNRFSVVDYGAITTNAGTPFERRLELIYDDLNLLMGKFHPEAMSIEKLFYNTNAKTVIDVAQARGVTVLAAKKNNIPIFEYTPLQVKQSVVGYGRAEKKQVQEMTRIILKLDKIPKPDDTADALAMAICHAHASGSLMGKLNSMGIR